MSPLLAAKRRAWNQVLCDDSPTSCQRFRQCERIVKHAVCDAKQVWIEKMAEVANVERDGKGRWSCVKWLQEVFRGRQSVWTSGVSSEDGRKLSEPVEVVAKWFHHFSGVLNVTSQLSQECVDRMFSLEVRTDLDDPPGEEEFESALGRVKVRKAGGTSRIVPEIWCLVAQSFIRSFWVCLERSGERVVCLMIGEMPVPPNRGNLNICDNWRGISLLDFVGKLLGRILQERLQIVAESVLPDSQCGFWQGRSCIDMIFVARQLVEKAREHNSLLFTLFIDLKKAYNSVLELLCGKCWRSMGFPLLCYLLFAPFMKV